MLRRPVADQLIKRIVQLCLLLTLVGAMPAFAGVNLDDWAWRGRFITDSDLRGVAYGNGMLVAVGDTGVLLTSPDGVEWTDRSSAISPGLNFRGAAFVNNLFVAVGDNGALLTSPDGIAWTVRDSGTTSSLKDVAYGNGLFAAVGSGGVVLTSADGVAWSLSAELTGVLPYSISYGDGAFVISGREGDYSRMMHSADAVNWVVQYAGSTRYITLFSVDYDALNNVFVGAGSKGQIVVSTDGGLTWSLKNTGFTYAFQGVGFANGIWTAVGETGGVYRSTNNGASWEVEESLTGLHLNAVTSYNTEFVTVGASGAILTSPDAITWSPRTAGTFGSLYDVACRDNTCVAVGYGKFIQTATDGGGSWEITHSSIFGNRIEGVAAGTDLFVAVGDNTIFTSGDGITWNEQSIPASLFDVVWADGQFVAVGAGSPWTSVDGVTWIQQTSTSSGTLYGITYGNGMFVAAGQSVTGYTSADGVNWSETVIETTYASADIYGITFGNGTFVAVGKGGRVYRSVDGINWSKTAAGVPDLLSVAFGANTFAAVGLNGNILTSEDGATWTPRNSGVAYTLEGIAFTGGSFITVGARGAILQTLSTRYVDIVNGSDANDGASPMSAWKTLHHTADLLADGDILYVAPGVYNTANGEPDSVLSIKRNVSVIGMDVGFTLDGTGNAYWTNGMELGAYGTSAEIVVRNATITGFSNSGIMVSSSGAVIEDCRIHSNNSAGILGIAGMAVNRTEIYNNSRGIEIQNAGDGVRISDCRVYGNRSEGIYVYGSDVAVSECELFDNGGSYSAGIYLDHAGTVDPHISGNRIYANGDYMQAYGIRVNGGSDITVSGNEIFGHYGSNFSSEYISYLAGIRLENAGATISANTIYNNQAGIVIVARGSSIAPEITNNLIYETDFRKMSSDSGSFETGPMGPTDYDDCFGIQVIAEEYEGTSAALPRIYHNTIDVKHYGIGIYEIGGSTYPPQASPLIRYNSISNLDPRYGGVLIDCGIAGGLPVIEANNLYLSARPGDLSAASSCAVGSGNTFLKPDYYKADKQDYHLHPYSQLIDSVTANDTVDPIATDLSGNSRPSGSKDMGCYEWVDSDGDGMDDQWELRQFDTLAEPGTGDDDGDGLSDAGEYLSRTNPFDPDTDHDGLSDSEEVNNYNTDPNMEDTDNDGLGDGDEIHRTGTQPDNPNSDADATDIFSDGEEVHYGSDPNDPASIPSFPGGHYYVDANNESEGFGNLEEPWRSLHHALDRINYYGVDGQVYTIHVIPGFYSVSGAEADEPLVISRQSVTITGSGSHATVIDGTGAIAWSVGITVDAADVTISNLSVSNFSGTGVILNGGNGTIQMSAVSNNGSEGIRIPSGNNVVSGCEIYENTALGVLVTGTNNTVSDNRRIQNNGTSVLGTGILVSGTGAANNVIAGNEFLSDSYSETHKQLRGIDFVGSGDGNAAAGNRISGHDSGIYVENSSPLLERNRLESNRTGIYVYGNGAAASPDIWNNLIFSYSSYNMDYGIAIRAEGVSGACQPRIYFNTIDRIGDGLDEMSSPRETEGAIFLSETLDSSAGADIYYNIITNTHSGIYYESELFNGIISVDYNVLYSIYQVSYNVASTGMNTIMSDPMFNNPYGGDYRLQPDSVGIDAVPSGPVPMELNLDIEAIARPQGTAFDIGCHEYAADYDKDGIDGATETANGTDPYEPDSDFDGWHDGEDTAPNDSMTHPILSSGTYYVSESNGTNGIGTQADPWRSIQMAVHHINQGNAGTYVLQLAAGTYSVATTEPEEDTGDNYFTITQDNVEIVGEGAELTIIDGSGAGFWYTGLTVTGSNVALRNLSVRNFQESGISVSPPYEMTVSGTLIDGCAISGNGFAGIELSEGTGYATITGTDVYNNGYFGISIENSANNSIGGGTRIFDNGGLPYSGYAYDNNGPMCGTGVFVSTYSAGSENNSISGAEVFWTGNGAYPQCTGVVLDGVSGSSRCSGNTIYGHPNVAVEVRWGEPEISGNRIYDNYDGIFLTGDDANLMPQVTNNLIYGLDPYDGFGIEITWGTSPKILHNTIDGGMIGMLMELSPGASPEIRYNIISEFGLYGIDCLSSDAATVIDFNNIFSSTSTNDYGTGCVTTGTTIAGDPLFVNPGSADFHLQSASPAIDAVLGELHAGGIYDDFDGNARPFNGSYDIGAYEFNLTVYTITADTDTNGTVSPNGTVAVSEGGSQTFYFTPNTGYYLQDVMVDGESVGQLLEYTFDSVTGNHTISATFAPYFAGGSGTSETDPYRVETAEQLYNIRNFLDSHFELAADINLSGYASGEGWEPIGMNYEPFAGTFNGNGYTIRNLSINRPDADYIGLFAAVQGGVIKNVNLENADITGATNVGGLVGSNNYNGIILNCRVAGSVTGVSYVGGLVGYNGTSARIEGCYSSASVDGQNNLGGLAGYQDFYAAISASGATGAVTGSGYEIGGLLGTNAHGSVSNCYATGEVTGTGAYQNSFGGLIGAVFGTSGGEVTDCYASGAVSGYEKVGGLVGNNDDGIISNCYAAGTVTGEYDLGGLVGSNGTVAVTQSFYNSVTTGRSDDSGKGTPKTTAEMLQIGTFAEWNFETLWAVEAGVSYPYFQWQTVLISTASEIANGATNPEVVVSLADDIYSTGADAMGNWSIEIGSTGLELSSTDIIAVSENQATIRFSGTAAAGTISIQVREDALNGGIASNRIALVVPASVAHTISAIAGAGGTINPNGPVSVSEGGSQVFAVTPNSGYRISDVLVDGVSIGAVSSYPFENVIGNHTITASFRSNDVTVNFTVANNGGSLAGEAVQTVSFGGQSAAVTAVAHENWGFTGWSGDYTGSENPLVITNVTSDMQIVAHFNQSPEKPRLTAPADRARIEAPPGAQTVSVDLVASGYLDAENDQHAETFWRYWEYNHPVTESIQSDTDLSRMQIFVSSGIRYQWQAGFRDRGSNQVRWSDTATFLVGQSVTDTDVPEVFAGDSVASYRMVSFVQWPDDPSASAVFSSMLEEAYDRNYRIGYYDPTFNGVGGYREYPDFEVEPGRSYWFLARNGMSFEIEGVPVSTRSAFNVRLVYNTVTENGWNQIACPNKVDYLWGDIQVVEYDSEGNVVNGPVMIKSLAAENDFIDKTIWQWTDGAYSSSASDAFTLEPYQGYWVRVKKPNVYLVFEPEMQLVLANPKIWLAGWYNQGRQWIGDLMAPAAAHADAEASPPMPMGGLDGAIDVGGGSGCFVDTTICGRAVKPFQTILILVGFACGMLVFFLLHTKARRRRQS